jgi:lysophospholipase L1-like esterase
MKPLILILAFVLFSLVAAAEQVADAPDVAAPKGKPWWDQVHQQYVARAKQGKIDVLFLGDSITQGWMEAGKSVWEKTFAPMNAVNFGIGGDKTENLLWRIENGEIDGISPKVVVLLIGINNTWTAKGNETDAKGKAIAGGTKAIIAKLQEKLPASKILLHAVFPMKDGIPPIVKTINAEAAKLENKPKIRFLDIGSKFTDADGKVSKEIMEDGLHLTTKGYQIWADALEPVLKEMMK